MKSFKRQFIEKYFEGESEIPYWDDLEQELLNCIEKDDVLSKPMFVSRTAVKAEVPHDTKERILLSYGINPAFPKYDLIVEAMEGYANQFNQSQPTAGGVKEEYNWRKEYDKWFNHPDRTYLEKSDITSEHKWRLQYDPEYKALWNDHFKACLQPSPSNPSIKRPTKEEIHLAAIKYAHENNSHQPDIELAIDDFEAGINWLLSIQPDK